MRTTRWTVLIVAAAAGIAGCGGSSHNSSTRTTAAVVATVPQAATTTTTVTTTTKPKPKPKPATSTVYTSAKPSARVTTIAGLPGIAIRNGTVERKTTPVPPVSGAKPAVGFMASCVGSAGLFKIELIRPNTWRAVAPVGTGLPVYVDGPYTTTSEAATSAASLLGIESAAPGGLYVVSAARTSHLNTYVNALGKCLARAGSAPSGQKPIRLPGG
jgi:hypothetical protein